MTKEPVMESALEIAEKVIRDYCGFGWACKEFPIDTKNHQNQIAKALESYANARLDEAAKTFDYSIETLQRLVDISGSPVTQRDLRLNKEWRDRILSLKSKEPS